MFVHQFVRSSIAFALVLTATAALADQPARRGYRDSIASSAPARNSVPGASYRDRVAPTVGATRVAGAAGYRDAFARPPAQFQARQIAQVGSR